MNKLIDMTGWKMWEHGVPDSRVIVIERSKTPHTICKNGRSVYFWKCVCICGKEFETNGCRLRSGRCKSCGCYQKELAASKRKTHGMEGTRLYKIWRGIKDRCLNENCPAYKNYGGRGISVCKDWEHSFVEFYEWATTNGYKDDLTIDRIDVDEDYCPNNCRWASIIQQNRNKRNNRFISYDNKTLPLCEWAEITSINASTLSGRIDRQWKEEDIFQNNIDKNKTNNNITFEHIVEYKGKRMNVKDLSRLCGVPYSTLHKRIVAYGWDVDSAAETPVRRYKK